METGGRSASLCPRGRIHLASFKKSSEFGTMGRRLSNPIVLTWYFLNKSTIEIGRSFLASSVNLLDKERDLVLLAANREVEAPG